LKKKIFPLLVLLVSLANVSFGQNAPTEEEPIIAERPGFTNPPQLVPFKRLQIETGIYYEYDIVKESGLSTDNFLYPTTFLRYGLSKVVELRAEVDIAGVSTSFNGIRNTETGLNPIILSTKVYLTKQKRQFPETALVASLALPYFGRSDFLPQYPAPGLAFYCMNTFSEKFNLGYNLGMQWNGNDANPTSYLSICPAYNFSSKVGGFVEVYSFFTKYQIPDFRCSAGLSYIPIPNLQFDVYGGPGIAGSLTNYFISAGISIRLPR